MTTKQRLADGVIVWMTWIKHVKLSMTTKQRLTVPVGAAVTAGVITLLVMDAKTWYAWLFVVGGALTVGFLARLLSPGLAQEWSTTPSKVPAAAPPLTEPVPTPSEVGNERTALETRVTGRSHFFVFRYPSSEVGPQGLYIPLTGGNIYFELVVVNASAVVLHGLSAEVTARAPLKHDGVSIVPQPGEDHMFLAEDLAAAHRRCVDAFKPLEVPHLEVLLDAEPPIVRPALDAGGRRVHAQCPEFPLLLQARTHLRLVLAPLTDDRRDVHWRLFADIECEGTRRSLSWDARVTAETGTRVVHPGGGDSEFVPVHVMVPHWDLKYPANIVSDFRDNATRVWQPEGTGGYLSVYFHGPLQP